MGSAKAATLARRTHSKASSMIIPRNHHKIAINTPVLSCFAIFWFITHHFPPKPTILGGIPHLQTSIYHNYWSFITIKSQYPQKISHKYPHHNLHIYITLWHTSISHRIPESSHRSPLSDRRQSRTRYPTHGRSISAVAGWSWWWKLLRWAPLFNWSHDQLINTMLDLKPTANDELKQK